MDKQKFVCDSCNFQAKTKYRFEYHMKTKRHKQIVEKNAKVLQLHHTQNFVKDTLIDHPIKNTSYDEDQLDSDFFHDNNALFKLFNTKSDISEYLNIIYDQAVNYNEFVNRVFVNHSDIIEIRDIRPFSVINHKFVKLMYKILFKYMNELPIEKRPVHLHKTICKKFGRSRSIENWYIREQNKWRKLDPNICIGTLDEYCRTEPSLNAEFYDKIMRPLLIQCIFLWTIRCINPNSESDKKEHYELGIALNKFLSCCEKSYLGCNFEPEEEEETEASVEDASNENFDY